MLEVLTHRPLRRDDAGHNTEAMLNSLDANGYVDMHYGYSSKGNWGISVSSKYYTQSHTDANGTQWTEGSYYTGFFEKTGDPFSFGNLGNQQQEQNSWQTNTNILNGAISTSWGAKENLIKYATKFDHTIENLKYVKGVKVVSRGLFWAQVGVSAYQAVGTDFFDPNASTKEKVETTTKSALDIGVAYVGTFCGPVGWAVAGLYFIGDVTGVNEKIGNAIENLFDW